MRIVFHVCALAEKNPAANVAVAARVCFVWGRRRTMPQSASCATTTERITSLVLRLFGNDGSGVLLNGHNDTNPQRTIIYCFVRLSAPNVIHNNRWHVLAKNCVPTLNKHVYVCV